MTLSAVLLVVALILFLLAAFGVVVQRVNFVALGLALLTLAALIGGRVIVAG